MSVFIEVEHVTTYRYHNPVEFSLHRIMFRPRAGHDIRVLTATVDAVPHSKQYWVQDVFSNSVAVVIPQVPADTLEFKTRFLIEHYGEKNLELPLAPEAENYPFQYSEDNRIDLAPFLPLQYPDDAPIVRDWVSQFLPKRGTIHTRDILTNLNAAIRSDFGYSAREAMGTQRPTETLSLRSGTCRDFALLMIEAARGMGIAARFVSGYLYDPALDIPGSPKLASTGLQQAVRQVEADHELPPADPANFEQGVRQVEAYDVEKPVLGAGATHAWMNVYLPGAGWVAYDPTNSLVGGLDLIRVAFTRKPEQAAPVSGSFFGKPGDFAGMGVGVKVRHVSQAEVIEAAKARLKV